MKKNVLGTVVFAAVLALTACSSSDNNSMQQEIASLEQRLDAEEARTGELEDKLALKNLVDTFSILADEKDAQAQTELFTEDASVLSYRNGELVSELNGRNEIGAGFGDFLSNFNAVYHSNGQQTLEIDGDTATGTSYCYVVMIADQEDGSVMTSQGVSYQDTYEKVDGQWLISNRKSTFMWTETKELAR